MKTSAAISLLMPMALLSACSSDTSPPPHTPDFHDALPRHFKTQVGGFSHGYEVKLQEDHLTYKSYGPAFELKDGIRVYPDRKHWQAFWTTTDKIGVWNWRPSSGSSDSPSWKIEMDHADKHLAIQGFRRYPTNAAPGSPDGDERKRQVDFEKFLSAVSKLIGGRAFH